MIEVCNYHSTQKKCYSLVEATYLVETGARRSYYKCNGCGEYHMSSMSVTANYKATTAKRFKVKHNKRFSSEVFQKKKMDRAHKPKYNYFFNEINLEMGI